MINFKDLSITIYILLEKTTIVNKYVEYLNNFFDCKIIIKFAI